jgi:hypothetical protein
MSKQVDCPKNVVPFELLSLLKDDKELVESYLIEQKNFQADLTSPENPSSTRKVWHFCKGYDRSIGTIFELGTMSLDLTGSCCIGGVSTAI